MLRDDSASIISDGKKFVTRVLAERIVFKSMKLDYSADNY